MDFIYHQEWQKEAKTLLKRYKNLSQGIESFKRLCAVQFNPTNPQQVIAPAKLHRIMQNDIWSIWKIELVIPNSGLRPNQWPRMWFAIKGSVVAFLCLVSHVDNYQDNTVNQAVLG